MSQNESQIRPEDEDPSRTLDAGGQSPHDLGGRLGCYKLLNILGEGGFGIVYLAEQQHPLKRLVALKVIKPGMDTKQVVARFETERQALALLDHPHIAQVFDAGTTEAGRPYFAMEYVKGIPITDYCDKYKLSTTERLRLFIPLCQAIQHAHLKGIIHRDIKPSNALVTLHDEKPVPKIIDFGVAKALHQRLTERTLMTEQGQFLGTPEYMSPEQAEMTGLDVDTRTDIYSLGVLLYELLAGCTPFNSEDLRSKGYVQMQRIICEQDPVKPSTRLTTLGDKLEQIARQHGATGDQLRKAVRGDLDWIVMKAMEKDRTRRYETASSLAQDLERHLSNEPVTARPPTTLYRFQKLVRRNKGVFTAVTLVAAALVIGLTASAVSLVRERQVRQLAVTAREQARAAEKEAVAAREEAVAAREKETGLRRQVQAQAYASDMGLAQQALALNDLGRTRRLLEGHRPAPGEADLRGWEWRYLWQECRSDALSELTRYPGPVYSVAYSPDGKRLAVAGLLPPFVDLWDVPGRQKIATLQTLAGHVVAFSPRGDLLAAEDNSNHVRLWRTSDAAPAGQLTAPGMARVLKFSPDGTRLACLSLPGEITVWDVDHKTVIRQIKNVRIIGVHIGSLDFAPDGRRLVLGGADYSLRVVDLASGNTDFEIAGAHPEPITFVAWAPKDPVIASGSGYAGGPIRLWDAVSGKPLGTLEGHTSWICELVFSADGQRLYSAGADQTIRIWDVAQRQCLATLRGSSDEVYGLALAPDGATLASAGKDGAVTFWNAAPRQEDEQPRVIGVNPATRPVFAPDNRVLAASLVGIIRRFDPATSEGIENLPALGFADISTVACSRDGTLLATGNQTGKIRVWSCAERRLLREVDSPQGWLLSLWFRPDGTRLLAIDAAGKAIWWDTRTWQTVQTLTVGPISEGAVSPDGRLLALGIVTTLRWLNAETGELLTSTDSGHRQVIAGMAFASDGTRAASVAEDGTVALWDCSTFQRVAFFKGHMQGAHGVAFSPDGRRLATGGGNRDAVKVWDLATGRELMVLPGHGSLFSYVAFSPDGRWLAACGNEGQLHLWDAPSWDEITAAEKKNGPALR